MNMARRKTTTRKTRRRTAKVPTKTALFKCVARQVGKDIPSKTEARKLLHRAVNKCTMTKRRKR